MTPGRLDSLRCWAVRHADLLLFLAATLLGAWVRLRLLHQVPVLTDETASMAFARGLANGHRSLISNDEYIGPCSTTSWRWASAWAAAWPGPAGWCSGSVR
jgi:hypothetical protein